MGNNHNRHHGGNNIRGSAIEEGRKKEANICILWNVIQEKILKNMKSTISKMISTPTKSMKIIINPY